MIITSASFGTSKAGLPVTQIGYRPQGADGTWLSARQTNDATIEDVGGGIYQKAGYAAPAATVVVRWDDGSVPPVYYLDSGFTIDTSTSGTAGTITLTFESPDLPVSLELTGLTRTDTGAAVDLPVPPDFVNPSGGIWTIDFDEPETGLTYTYIATATWDDATTSVFTGVVVGTGSGISGEGDTPVTADTLDDAGDTMYVRTSGGVGIDDVLVRAYVAADWIASPLTAQPQAETRSNSTGAWEKVLMLESGTQYAMVFSKSGYNFEETTVTP